MPTDSRDATRCWCHRGGRPTAPAEAPANAQRPDFKPAESTLEATDESIKANYAALDESVQRLRATWRDKTFEQFEAEVYKEPFEGGKYIVNGDVAIGDLKHLREYFDQLKAQFDDTANGKLIVNRISDSWKRGIGRQSGQRR